MVSKILLSMGSCRDETEWTVEVADLGIYKPNTTMSSVEYAQVSSD